MEQVVAGEATFIIEEYLQEVRSALAGHYKGEIFGRNHAAVERAETPIAPRPGKVVILNLFRNI
jgi:hypothetical protein